MPLQCEKITAPTATPGAVSDTASLPLSSHMELHLHLRNRETGVPRVASRIGFLANKTDVPFPRLHQISPTTTHDPEPTDGVKMVLPESVTHMACRILPLRFGTGKSKHHPSWRAHEEPVADSTQCLSQRETLWPVQSAGQPRRECQGGPFPPGQYSGQSSCSCCRTSRLEADSLFSQMI